MKRASIYCRILLLSLLLLSSILVAQQPVRLEDEAVQRLQQYLRIDTVNPPGNESRAVEFFAGLLEQEKIPYETAESAPGRGNLWARLEGGDEPALILLNHTDVVPADARYWDEDPFSGAIKNGEVYGRGALDMKGTGMMQFQAFLALHRAGRPLKRDVVFVATADEEAGGFLGAGWLIEHHPEIFEGAGFLLNEGGGASPDGHFGVEVTQKVPLWIRLVATGEPGHGSRPRMHSAPKRLLRALSNIDNFEFPAEVVPAVDRYFKLRARRETGPRAEWFSDLGKAVKNPEIELKLRLESPFVYGLTRNTCTITRMQGSDKINVVAPEAWAEIDCRLLPNQDPDQVLATLNLIVNDPTVRIEKLMAFTPAESSTDTELYRAIEEVCHARHPGSEVVPLVSTGFTDSHFFRDIGIVSYGFDPSILPGSLGNGVHGNNERIPVTSVHQGLRDLIAILEKMTY